MTETQNTNRLVNETSTYLLQHAHNPVDWYPWGSEALERSKLEQKPILLSIGYAACHWCHVMEHESFEDAETAALMNKLFVNIKVDREERTDLDEIYMKAVQMLTGHGGWPMTVFLTPELKPFYGGTYFPPNDRHGLPGFKKLLVGVNNAWTERKAEVIESASEITEALRSMDQLPMGDAGDHPARSLDQSLIVDAAEKMLRTFDRQWGGFGSAPKFPHSFSISLAMRAALIAEGKGEKNLTKDFKELVKLTLDKMAFGGMQDQLGGGFARYSVDRKWLIPHFEKMLYDNALLCKTYLEGYAWTGSEYWRRVADELIGFVLRELKTEGGAFYSSLDADSEGEEGKFYVWTPSQIRQILGTESGGKDEDADFFCDVFGVTETGNFEHGTSALNLVKSPEELASKHGISVAQFWDRVDKLRVPLMAERDKRIRPGRDEKVLTSWNSLMISALVDGYRVLKKPEYLQAAKVATEFIFANLMKDGRLLRTWGKGKAKLDGYMDDYAYFIQALLDLASVDFDPRWFNEAQRLTELSLELFWDEKEATFFYTSSNHETLITRPKNQFDGSIPSPISVSISNLMRLSRLTHQEQYAKCAETLIHRYSELALKYPDQFSNLLCALDFTIQESVEIAIVKSKSQQAEELIFAAHEGFLPNRLVLVSDGELAPETAILRGRGTINGKPAAYLCQNYVCESPTTEAAPLRDKVQTLAGKF